MANRLMIKVRTFNLETGELDSDKEVDINKPGAAKWLWDHSIWAWLNGMGVQTCNVNDWEPD